MNYGNILTTTWQTLWKHKVIYGFGMLVMIVPAMLGVLLGGVLAYTSLRELERFFATLSFEGVGAAFFFLAYFLFILLSILLSALSFSGMFKGVLLAQSKSEGFTFAELWDASMPYLWRMLGIIFSVGFALVVIYLVPLLLLALIGALTAGVGFLCAIPFFLLLIPVGLVGYLFLSLSMAALVAEDNGVLDAIQRAWSVLKAKFWALVLMTIILYVIQVAIGMVILIPMQVMQFAFILPMSAGNANPEESLRYFGLLMAISMPFMYILQSLGMTYANGAWIFTWLEASAPAQPENDIVEYEA